MTTETAAVGTRTMETTETMRPRRSLEELVDRLFEAMGFGEETETVEQSATRSIHEARRLRQAGDVDGALAALGSANVAQATLREARWAFSEWRALVKRRFGDQGAMLYTQGTGRAAALVPHGDGGMLEVAAVLGMRWRPGKVVSERSLRGLRPLTMLALDHPLGTLPVTPGNAPDLALPGRTRRTLAPACLGRARR